MISRPRDVPHAIDLTMAEMDKILESLNRELLAANWVLRESLQKIIEYEEMFSEGFKVKDLAKDAIDKQDYHLVEVGKTIDYETPIANIVQGMINQGVESGLTLYTIKTKSNTE